MLRNIKTAVLLLCCHVAFSYKYFQTKIPNGENVPHPCKPNYIWQGVGHENEKGGGNRNPFGRDFHAAGMKWTEELCQKDSDGDGKTNGQELGDPNCIWKEGNAASQLNGLSHPGICEPYDSSFCKSRNSELNCDIKDFQCDALTADTDARNFTIKFPPTQVPPTETNYYCMTFKFDIPGDYHLIATQPFIDNAYVMHHILLFGCDGDAVADSSPKPCGMGSQNCNSIIGTWAVGLNGECFNKNIGFRIGDSGYKYMSVQFHWNNPELRSDYIDGSGMILHYTPNRRVHDAGVLMAGQTYIQIPPGMEQYEVVSTCPKEVTKYLVVNDGVYFTRALNHMHYLGRRMKIEHFRNGVKLRDITNDEVYSYDDPVMYEFENGIQFLSGDEIKISCYFKSTSRSTTVFYGDGTSDEMCFGFLTFHPAQNMISPYCTSWKGIPFGLLYNPSVRKIEECQFREFFNVSHSYTADVYNSVMRNCDALSNCLTECMDVVREARKHPCLKGDIGEWIRKHALEVNAVELLYFYMKLDSCNAELEKNACPTCPQETCLTGVNSASTTGLSVVLSLFSAITLCLVFMFSK